MTPAQDQWNTRVDAARRAKFERTEGMMPFEPREPKPGSRHPFKRAAKLYTEIMETRSRLQGDLSLLQYELSQFPPYVSRGRGWKGRIKNRTILGAWNQDRSKPYPNPGRSEAARRVFQSLQPWERKLAREIEVGL